jgi:hypothetical protein
MDSFFDTQLLESGQDPWLHNVFTKTFDAYFFIEYPHLRNAHEPIELFDFTTNFQEKTLYVESLNPDRQIEHFYNQRYSDVFFDIFKEKDMAAERFLFWRGESGLWAMFSDTESKIAVIGVDWRQAYSGSVTMMFRDFIIPIPKLQEKLPEIDILKVLSNYAPSKILTEGNDENPLMVKYYFESNPKTEDDKLFYWAQFEPLYNILSATISDFKLVKMWACQHFNRLYRMKNQIYSSGSNAPVGGWQKFSHANCHKVATKFLTNNKHLQLQFEGKQDEAQALYFQSKKGLVEFYAWWLCAHPQDKEGGVESAWNDFYFLLDCNCIFQFFYRKGVIDEVKIQKLYDELMRIGSVSKVFKVEKPNLHFAYDADGVAGVHSMYGFVPK